MNTFINGLNNATNYAYTENGALTHKTTNSALYDMFAMGGAYRSRSNDDVILLFKNAFEEDPNYALKCLFYLRDVRGGQGERRFFRVCLKWLASNYPNVVISLLEYIPEFGRYDDYFTLVDVKETKDATLNLIRHQLNLDIQSKTPSLLGKWMPSENTSSFTTRNYGHIFREYLNMTHKQYRKVLAELRSRINIVEKLMSENRWDEIEFDKIPSRAGMIYKNAFARRDIIKKKYENFAKDTTTKVNASTLYPYECVDKAINLMFGSYYSWNSYDANEVTTDNVDRLMINKYWDNLADYFNDSNFNAMAVVDTSGSMRGCNASAPINVAISLGLYCAEKCTGPYHGYYMSFASQPQFIKTNGIDFCDKVARIYETNLCDNTNIEAAFNLMLNTAIKNKCKQEELPQNLIIISDMEFDQATNRYAYCYTRSHTEYETTTLMENIEKEWNANGYKMPNLIFWNVNARHNNVAMEVKNGISYVSGMSPSIFKQIMSGKTAYDLMYETLNSDRYSVITYKND